MKAFIEALNQLFRAIAAFLDEVLGGGKQPDLPPHRPNEPSIKPVPPLPEDAPPGAYPIIYGRRDELDVALEVRQGEIPQGLYGVMYWTAPAGSVNSGGLPYPRYYHDGEQQEYNKEYGSPLMVSDGLLFKLQLGEDALRLRSKVVETPCLLADQAVGRYGRAAKDHRYDHWGFRNLGMIRVSFHLGLRNLLNTAVIPFQFEGDAHPRTALGYDLGRQFEVDPDSMRLMTPIGGNEEWEQAMPSFMKMAFPMVQSTAHPTFDPETKEFYTVNYVRSMDSILSNVHLIGTLINDEEKLEKHLEKLAREWEQHHDAERSRDDLKRLTRQPQIELNLGEKLADLFDNEAIEHLEDAMMPENKVILMRWDGKAGPLKKTRVVCRDDNGQEQDIEIEQCMHQTQVTRDYILLSDSSFKTSLSIMVNNPFPHNDLIDRFLREILAQPMLPYLQLYIIKKADLAGNPDKVVAIKAQPIPLESVHYSANYANPGQELTLFMSVNSSACMAEWLRSYDRAESLEDSPVLSSMLGMFAVGTVDINKIGRYVIHAETGQIKEEASKVLYEEGNTADPANVGAHTWQLGLYTYKNIISPREVVEQIDYLYTLSFGLDPRTLTSYVYRLYKDAAHNAVPAERVRELSAVLQTHALLNIETANMEIVDYYQFDQDVNPRAVQFVPSRAANPGIPEQRHGFIVCSMNVVTNPTAPFAQRYYRPEIWIFDANDLGQQRPDGGPLCKLGHPDITWGYGLHSAWVEEAIYPGQTDYHIDIRQDYDQLIQDFWLPWKRHHVQQLFDEYVYPQWYANRPGNRQ